MKNYLYLFSGSLIFALSVAWVASPVGLVSGGVSGIGIIVKALCGGIPIALTSFIFNLPLFIISFFQRGFSFITKSGVAFLSLTLFLFIAESVEPPFSFGGDTFAASLVYGGLSGVGLGLVLRSGATSGGTDMLAAIIKRKVPHLKMAHLILLIDVAVIMGGVFLFGVSRGIYATLALVVSSRVMDGVVNGFSTSKAVFILSGRDREISRFIIEKLCRGATGLDAKGLFTDSKKTLIFSVVSKREVVRLRKAVGEIDPEAFVFVTDAVEVLGEGFENILPNEDFLG